MDKIAQFLLMLWCGLFFIHLHGVDITILSMYITLLLNIKYLIYILYALITMLLFLDTDKGFRYVVHFNVYIIPSLMFLFVFPVGITYYAGSFSAELSDYHLGLIYKSLAIGTTSAILSYIVFLYFKNNPKDEK